MKKIVSIIVISALSIIGTISVFATSLNSSLASTERDLINNGKIKAFITSLGGHIINCDFEYQQTNSYPTYTIYPTDSSGNHLTTIKSTTTNSLGGSINLNSPTSTGSQTGRYTISDFSTTTTLYGFKAIPSGGTSSNVQHTYYCVQYDFLFYTSIENNNNNTVEAIGSFYLITPEFNFTNTPSLLGMTLEPLTQNGIYFDSINSGRFGIVPDSDHLYNNHFLLAPNQRLDCMFMVSFFALYVDSYTTDIPPCSITLSNGLTTLQSSSAPPPSVIAQLSNLNNTLNFTYNDLHELKESYISANRNYNSNNASSMVNDADTQNNTLDSIHQSEAQYYQQNQQAIEDTGLTNFNYSPEQLSSFSVLITDFNNLWNALDGWTFVYIFSLTISLALLIIRHAPIRRKKGGDSNA